jgi:site-specific DNA-methyltransferase (adenine-specific)
VAENTLYYGDNLDVLRRHVQDETVDLIYLDPPFNSKATYNVLFGEQNGAQAAAQIKAFEDTWRWDQAASQAYQEVVEAGGKVSQVMQSFRTFLGDNDMLAYLAMMAPRLVELRRVLKPTGSIYLHCDPTASHYLKVLMDAVFGADNFQNEIIWCFKTGGATKRRFARKHNILLFYAKNDNQMIFNVQKEKSYMMHKYGFKKSNFQEDEQGQYSWVIMKDWWEIPSVGSADSQRLGYPTQKPEPLMERIIQASSNEGDLVLDPFCGCGTTIAVAERMKRQWIGIDITHLAITLIKHRLHDAFVDPVNYQVIGEPVSPPDAQTLAEQDPYQFQWWALGLVGARPVEQKKGSDKGIDGRIYFHDEAEGGKTKQIVLSVKAGHTSVDHVRDLRGVVEREQAEIGVLLTMQEPTQPMRSEVAGAGFYNSLGWNQNYPKLQILTIAELLAGKGIDMPPIRQVSATFKKAPRAKKHGSQTQGLPGI